MRSSTVSSTPSEPGTVSRSSARSRAATTSVGAGARRCEAGASRSVQRSRMTTCSSGSRFDQPARSRPGSGGRSSGQPRQSQPRVSTPSGRPSSSASSVGSKSVTQPSPRPWARAVSQMFSIAAAHDHRSASGKVARPSTPAAGVRRSQATTTPRGASRMPSSRRSSSPRADSSAMSAACRRRLRSAIRAAASRVADSVTTTKRHGCEWPTEGARWPAASTAVSTSSGTGSGRKRRMSRRAPMTRSSAARSSRMAQASGACARSAADVASPIVGTGRRKLTMPSVVRPRRRADRRLCACRRTPSGRDGAPAVQTDELICAGTTLTAPGLLIP